MPALISMILHGTLFWCTATTKYFIEISDSEQFRSVDVTEKVNSQNKCYSKKNMRQIKEVFRTCNVLPFSCTHLALWRGQRQGKRPKVHAKQKGFKNFVNGYCC